MQTTVKDPKAVVRQGYEALNNRDRDLFRKVHAEDVVLHDTNGDVHGTDALVEHQWAFIEAFRDLNYEIGDIVAEGNMVAVRHTLRGIHEGELQGIAPTGAEVEVPVMIMFRIENDKIAEVWLHDDRLAMLQQLGSIESPEA